MCKCEADKREESIVFGDLALQMGCGGSKSDEEEDEDDVVAPDELPRSPSAFTGVGMDFFGDLNAELVRPTPPSMRHISSHYRIAHLVK